MKILDNKYIIIIGVIKNVSKIIYIFGVIYYTAN